MDARPADLPCPRGQRLATTQVGGGRGPWNFPGFFWDFHGIFIGFSWNIPWVFHGILCDFLESMGFSFFFFDFNGILVGVNGVYCGWKIIEVNEKFAARHPC